MKNTPLAPLLLALESAAVDCHEASKAWGDAIASLALARSTGRETRAHVDGLDGARDAFDRACARVGACRADLQLAFATLNGKVSTGAGGAILPADVCVHGWPEAHGADGCPECFNAWCDREMAAELARDSLLVDRDEAHESDRESYSEAVGSGRKG